MLEGDIKRIAQQIRQIALTGQTDTSIYEGRSDEFIYDAEIDIHWQLMRPFLLVYIESYGKDTGYYYRIYRCAESVTYDRRTILDQKFENDDCYCLFDYMEDYDRRELVRIDNDGGWIDEFEEALC